MLVTSESTLVYGEVRAGFETVRDVFAENFAWRGERGGAWCVYRRGEKAVDLRGGVAATNSLVP